MTARLISATALCALCAGVLFAQQTAPRGAAQGVQSPPVFRSSVEAVQVDVYVADKDGRPVTDLTAGDFQVLENNEPQILTTFSSVNIPTERSEPPPFGAEPDVQTNNRPERHVFLFILSGAAPDWALRTRYLVRKFMDEHFGDNDIAAVITGRTFPGDRQDFTSNRRMLLAAVDRYSGEGIDRYELADLMEMMTRVPGGRKVAVWFGCPGIDGFDLIDYHGEKLFTDAEAVHAAVAAATRGNIRIYVIDPVGLVGTEGGGCDGAGHARVRRDDRRLRARQLEHLRQRVRSACRRDQHVLRARVQLHEAEDGRALRQPGGEGQSSWADGRNPATAI